MKGFLTLFFYSLLFSFLFSFFTPTVPTLLDLNLNSTYYFFFTDVILFPLQDSRPDDTYFSADCFHFSERGHADMAVALWNNMVSLTRRKEKG